MHYRMVIACGGRPVPTKVTPQVVLLVSVAKMVALVLTPTGTGMITGATLEQVPVSVVKLTWEKFPSLRLKLKT